MRAQCKNFPCELEESAGIGIHAVPVSAVEIARAPNAVVQWKLPVQTAFIWDFRVRWTQRVGYIACMPVR